MSGPLPPAVVLGGSFNAVSVVRSLSRIGADVTALGDPMSAVRGSRECSRFVDLGRGDGMQSHWLEWLGQEVREGTVLLPCDDDGLELIARNRPALVKLGYQPFEADDEVVLAMLDKDHSYRLAREIGVRAPLTAAIRGASDLDGSLDAFRYPCALKPIHSHLFARAFGRSLKAFTVESREQLEQQLRELVALHLEMLVTEIVPGDEDQFVGYYSYIDGDGRRLFDLTKRKLRQFPPDFGMGCYHVTSADPEVVEVGARFLEGVGARGLANVELKRDARDGELTLIECNHRFTAINDLLRVAGADLAVFAYNRLVGRPNPPLDGYRAGVRFWYPLQDTRAAVRLRRRGSLSLGGWLRSIAHRQHTPLFEWRDPRPTFTLAWARAMRELKRRRA